MGGPARRKATRTRFTPRVRSVGRGSPALAVGPVLLAVSVYGGLSALAIALAAARGQSAVTVRAWLPVGGALGHAASLVVGMGLAAATLGATRMFVRRYRWAKELHADLRPSIRHAAGSTLVVLGVTSAIGEELFFRGLLAGLVGGVASSVFFGLLHQLRGRGRWAWAAWATVMGLLFAVLYFATGSLLGPVVAHAAINVQNLRFLRDTDVCPDGGDVRERPRRFARLLRRA
jgi:membrane protease YdiL (CAAX protease family)